MRNDDGALGRALAYARHGWPVFPCKSGTKEPDTPHGFNDATTNAEQIAAWWREEPDRNVAIATGAPGPDVLDVDVRPQGNGYGSYGRLKRAGLLAGTLAIVATPSGGLHAYYTGTGQRSGRLPAQHLDFKAAGGYVVAPPSQVGGKLYQVIQYRRQAVDGGIDWAAAVSLLEPRHERQLPTTRQRTGSCDADRLAAWVAALGEGNRNAGLFWAACRLVEAGQTDTLDTLADGARTAGLPDREIWRTITSARRAAVSERPCRAAQQPIAEHEAQAMI